MEIGFIGLGRMGKNMVLRLLEKKHKIVVHNRSPEPMVEVAKKGAKPTKTFDEFFKELKSPRIVWMMLPAGQVTEDHMKEIEPYMQKGDIVIDGGNANFKDSVRRAEWFSKKGVKYLDVGTSGGIVAAKIGYCLMVGGDKEAFTKLEPAFKSLAIDEGYEYMGSSGAGHYVKMVHNAIEYGMMQAMAEGFELLQKSQYSKDIDMKKITHIWNHGSIVRGFLMEMAENAFTKEGRLESIPSLVEDNGEGKWAIQEALDRQVAFNVITTSLYTRYQSRQKDSFAHKTLAALRNEFGGHALKSIEGNLKTEKIKGAKK
jgi:6-phosphogluconate dehydrogenase